MIHVKDALSYYRDMDQYSNEPFTYIKIISAFYDLDIVFDGYHGCNSEDPQEYTLKNVISDYGRKSDGRANEEDPH